MAEPSIGAWLIGEDQDWKPPGPPADEAPQPTGPRRLWLVALAVWVAVASLALIVGIAGRGAHPQVAADGDAAGPAGTSADPATTPATTATTATPTAAATPTIPATPPPTDPSSATGGPGDRPTAWGDAAEIGAAATTAVRLGVTQAPGGAPRYVDHAAVEGMTWIGDTAVVAVRAVVLEGHGDGWGEPAVRRYAVAVSSHGNGARAVSAPWPLPPPAGPPREQAGAAPVDDPALLESATEALTRAGYAEPVLEALTRDPRHPEVLLARVVARAPGDERAGTYEVWLHASEPVNVLGTDSNARIDNEEEP